MLMKMMSMFVLSALLALTSCASIEVATEPEDMTKTDAKIELFDGIDLTTLNEKELNSLMDAEDEIFVGELNILLFKNSIVRNNTNSHRQKRTLQLFEDMFRGGLEIIKEFAIAGARNHGRNQLSRQYSRRGTYADANRDFDRMDPYNIRYNRNSYSTGTMGQNPRGASNGYRMSSAARRPSRIGTYADANRDFNRMDPYNNRYDRNSYSTGTMGQNPRGASNGYRMSSAALRLKRSGTRNGYNFQGRTGMVGQHQVAVRGGSSQSSESTLVFQTQQPNGGRIERIFSYYDTIQ